MQDQRLLQCSRGSLQVVLQVNLWHMTLMGHRSYILNAIIGSLICFEMHWNVHCYNVSDVTSMHISTYFPWLDSCQLVCFTSVFTITSGYPLQPTCFWMMLLYYKSLHVIWLTTCPHLNWRATSATTLNSTRDVADNRWKKSHNAIGKSHLMILIGSFAQKSFWFSQSSSGCARKPEHPCMCRLAKCSLIAAKFSPHLDDVSH